jgi:outer membrane lipoprotein-sorting protein
MPWPAYLGIAVSAIIILIVFVSACVAAKQADDFFQNNPEILEILEKREKS